MKKRIQKLVCLLLLAINMVSYASHSYVPSTKKTPTIVSFNNVKKGHQLIIKDANLLILYKESIQKNGHYSKGFDLTSLPDGTYYFELDKDVEICVIPFTVNANQVTFEKEKETIIYKPTVRLDGRYLYVSRLSLDTQPLKVELHYRESSQYEKTLLFSEEIKNKKIFERIYELSKEKKGEYILLFKSQGREFINKLTY